MACEPECECLNYFETEIKDLSLYKEYESFFLINLQKNIFTELKPDTPYYSFGKTYWYADKWYKCKICGCLWEYTKPDFPSSGFVRKFENGVYLTRGY